MIKHAGELYYCLADPLGGQLSVCLSSSENINVHAELKLLDRSADRLIQSIVLESSKDNGSKHPLAHGPAQLPNLEATLRLELDCQGPGLERGKLQLVFIQDRVQCLMSKPLHWELQNILPLRNPDHTSIDARIKFLNI